MQTIDLPTFTAPAPKGLALKAHRTRQEVQADELNKFLTWRREEASRPWWAALLKWIPGL